MAGRALEGEIADVQARNRQVPVASAAASRRRSLLGAASVLAVGLAGWSGAAHADGLATLDSYIKHSKSGQATFTQTVTNVNKKGTARQSSGTFSFKRPGQFRFDYTKPFKQTIVADGKTLWMYDAGLNQVTQRSQAQVLDATPAALVASATSLKSLQTHYKLENATGPGWPGVGARHAQGPGRPDQERDDRFPGQGPAFAGDPGQLRPAFRYPVPELWQQAASNVSFNFKPPAGADVLKRSARHDPAPSWPRTTGNMRHDDACDGLRSRTPQPWLPAGARAWAVLSLVPAMPMADLFPQDPIPPLAEAPAAENAGRGDRPAAFAGRRQAAAAGVPVGQAALDDLWGPPGVGKTTLARLTATAFDCAFIALSAVFSGVKDIRAAMEQAEQNLAQGRHTILFVDEIHRFNKSQQDALLPYAESGLVTFIGATTENPSV